MGCGSEGHSMGDEESEVRKEKRMQEIPPTKWWNLVVGYFVAILSLLILFMALTWGLGLMLILEFPLETITLVAILALPFTLYLWWTSRKIWPRGPR